MRGSGAGQMGEGAESGAQLLEPIGSVIRSHRSVRLALGVLADEIEGWPRSKLPWINDSWVSPVDVEGLGVAIRAVGRSQSGNPCRGPR